MDGVARGTVQWIERAAGAAVATVSQSVHHLITTNSSRTCCDRSIGGSSSGRDPLSKATDNVGHVSALGAVAVVVALVGTVQYGTSMDPVGRCWRFWKQLNRQVRACSRACVRAPIGWSSLQLLFRRTRAEKGIRRGKLSLKLFHAYA
jgi:hypothetical protein